MQSVQKMGGIGALIAAGTFLVGMGMFVIVFTGFVSAAPAAAVEFIDDNQLVLRLWNVTSTVAFGIALVPLVLAIGDRLREAHSPLARVASVFGLIWAGVIISTGMITNIAYATVSDLYRTDPEIATTAWAGFDGVANGPVGGHAVIGGIWLLGVSIVALRERLFSRWVNRLGEATGVAGLLTVVPAVEEISAAVGVGLTIWLTAVGIELIADSRQPAKTADPPSSRDITYPVKVRLQTTTSTERQS